MKKCLRKSERRLPLDVQIHENFQYLNVVKSLVLSKKTHIASVLPTPPIKVCELFDDAINDFVQGKKKEGKVKNRFIPENILYARKTELGFGPKKIQDFWNALKMPWLNKLQTPSTWSNLYIIDTESKKIVFDPLTATENSLKAACIVEIQSHVDADI